MCVAIHFIIILSVTTVGTSNLVKANGTLNVRAVGTSNLVKANGALNVRAVATNNLINANGAETAGRNYSLEINAGMIG